MITFAGMSEFGELFAYLNENHPSPVPLRVSYLPDFETLSVGGPYGEDISKSWANYDVHQKLLWIMGRTPEGFENKDEEYVRFTHLCHIVQEYLLHLRHCGAVAVADWELKERAEIILKDFFAKGQKQDSDQDEVKGNLSNHFLCP